MTALAGCIGLPENRLEQACRTMVQAQHAYGDVPRGATLLNASFGVALRQHLPEDALDCQPLIQSGRFMLIADVRLDNRDELLAALGRRAEDLADSEI